MSDTPKTDALDAELRQQHPTGYYPASMVLFARQLESELSRAKASLATLAGVVTERDELSDQLMRWFKAASPYATPGSLEAALKRFHARSEYCVVCNPRPADAAPSPPPQSENK